MNTQERFRLFQSVLDAIHSMALNPDVIRTVPDFLIGYEYLLQKNIALPEQFVTNSGSVFLETRTGYDEGYDHPDLCFCLIADGDGVYHPKWDTVLGLTETTCYDPGMHMIHIRVPLHESPLFMACCLLHEANHACDAECNGRAGNPDSPRRTPEEILDKDIEAYTFELNLFRALGGLRYRKALAIEARKIISCPTVQFIKYSKILDEILGERSAFEINPRKREAMFMNHVNFTMCELLIQDDCEQHEMKKRVLKLQTASL